MNQFETREETSLKHLTIALLIIAFMLSALLTFMIVKLEQSHKTTNQTYKNQYYENCNATNVRRFRIKI